MYKSAKPKVPAKDAESSNGFIKFLMIIGVSYLADVIQRAISNSDPVQRNVSDVPRKTQKS